MRKFTYLSQHPQDASTGINYSLRKKKAGKKLDFQSSFQHQQQAAGDNFNF
jgi:hypothetical protein